MTAVAGAPFVDGARFTPSSDHTLAMGYSPSNSDPSSLECPTSLKLMFDCRVDSDALFHQHGVSLRGVYDAAVVAPVSKALACGDVGVGALADVDDVAAAARAALGL